MGRLLPLKIDLPMIIPAGRLIMFERLFDASFPARAERIPGTTLLCRNTRKFSLTRHGAATLEATWNVSVLYQAGLIELKAYSDISGVGDCSGGDGSSNPLRNKTSVLLTIAL